MKKRKLNLGCGKNILKGYMNVDFIKNKGVDLVFDMEKTPWNLEKNYFNEVIANDILEHLYNPEKVIREIYRILSPKGILKIHVPYYNCAVAHTPNHKSFFYRDSFLRYSKNYPYHSLDAFPKYDIIKLNLIPTRFGKLFPNIFNIRYFASLIFGEVIQGIYVELRK